MLKTKLKVLQRELNEELNKVDQLYSIEAAAELLSLSPWTLRAWITQKRIGSVKLGSRRLIAQSEIKRLIREGPLEVTE
jgi:excisionase family DNA binding protein